MKKFSTWLRDARDLALGDYGVKRVSDREYRALFDEGLTPRQAAEQLRKQRFKANG